MAWSHGCVAQLVRRDVRPGFDRAGWVTRLRDVQVSSFVILWEEGPDPEWGRC